VGIKSRWFENTLQANAEVYYDWYNNYSESAAVSLATANGEPACDAAANAPPGATVAGCYTTNIETTNLVSKGADIDLTYLVTPDDKITSSLSYLEATWGQQRSNIPNFSTTIDGTTYNNVGNALAAYLATFSGATLQNSPKWTINTSYAHTFDLGDAGTITPSIAWTHKSSYYSNLMGGNATSSPFYVQPTYDSFNLYLSYTTLDGKYAIDGWCNNLTNAVIVTNSSNGGPPGSSTISPSQASVDLAPPREWGVNVTAKF